MSRFVTLALATLCLAGAVWMLLLAVDVQRWHRTLENDDMQFRTASGRGDLWQQDEMAPAGKAKGVLSIDDDLAYRRAVRAFLQSHPRRLEYSDGRVLALRGEAQEQLAEVARKDRDPKRRSSVENLLGALDLVAAAQDDMLRTRLLQSSVARFQKAISLDPRNDDAKHNLELAFSRLQAGKQPSGPDSPQGQQGPGGSGAAVVPRTGSGY